MSTHCSRWLRLAIFNLLVVALLGVVMRYKISFSLPYVDQKHLLHAHSHFAFAGWVTQTLMVLLVHYLYINGLANAFVRYKWVLMLNAICAYGMLLAFIAQGYGFVSIGFSTLSILVYYTFAYLYLTDIGKLQRSQLTYKWFKAALFFGVLSTMGTFALSGMMATQTMHQNWYLAAIYFYLHFQYNGWFFFACAGLLFHLLRHTTVSYNTGKGIFWLFTLACIPAYVLSALWLPLPGYTYAVVGLSAVAQVAGFILLVPVIRNNYRAVTAGKKAAMWLFGGSFIALGIKLLLQLGSTVPFLSNLAFGYRPIVIGYLHLVLLGVITLFLLGYITQTGLIPYSRLFTIGVFVFAAGIVVNELLLMVQGVAAMELTATPYINEMLLAAALIMFSGIVLANAGVRSPLVTTHINKI